MTRKLSADNKVKLLKRAEAGEAVLTLCKEAQISRALFYKIKASFNYSGSFASDFNHPRQVLVKNQKLILSIVRRYPEYSSKKISDLLPKDKKGRPLVGNHGVQNVLTRLNLSTYKLRLAFSRGEKEIRKVDTNALPRQKLTPQERLLIIKKVEAGEKISEVCRNYGISRPLFYRLLKRYRQSLEAAKGQVSYQQELAALEDRKPIPHHLWKLTDESHQKKVLELVSKYPQLSAHKLVQVLPTRVSGRPILSNKGVQNILKRHNLSTYAQRLAYSRLTEEAWKPRFSLSDILYIPLKIWRQLYAPFATIPKLGWLFTRGQLLLLLIFVVAFYFFQIISTIVRTQTGNPIGLIFASVSLTFGLFFFLYSLKYYLSVLMVLKLAQSGLGESQGEKFPLRQGFGGQAKSRVNPLLINLEKVELTQKPFVSIHLAVYNEKKVIERLIQACTSQEWPNYEVVIVDDSTDETTEMAKQKLINADFKLIDADLSGSAQIGLDRRLSAEKEVELFVFSKQGSPTVKLIHRTSRAGFKGGALQTALEYTDSRAGYVIVLDSDFVPYPDTIEQFVKTFQVLSPINAESALISAAPKSADNQPKSAVGDIAAVQGYQWHVLNKSENWITRGVRTEYAGSYVIERASEEIYGGLKQIAGSVYAIRADILRQFGWGTSITEDFELTLRLYEAGYKVAFTPYIQAPAEAVSTIRRLIRQRMRWAEGASFNVKIMLSRLLFGHWESAESAKKPSSSIASLLHGSIVGEQTQKQFNNVNNETIEQLRKGKVWVPSRLSLTEKLEFIYLAPYYLQAAFFVIGTLSWFISEAILKTHLPFWTATLGWSLVFTNLLSLPLMNIVGLFLEESDERDYLGIFSFMALSYIMVPFQAYAAIKGFLEKQEGPWFRTPKTGVITDVIHKAKFYRWMGRFWPFGGTQGKPEGKPATAAVLERREWNLDSVWAYSAYNRFENFKIGPKRNRWPGRAFTASILLVAMGINFLANSVPLAKASPGTQVKTVEFFIYQYASASDITTGNGINGLAYSDANDVSFTANLPESGTPTVRHAYVEWWTRVGAQSPTSGEMKFDLCDTGCTRSSTTQTLGAAVASSGENQNFMFRMAVSAEVTGGSHTYKFNAQLTGTSLVRNGDNAKLVITYEYDDTATTQVRTRKYAVACGTGTTTPTSGTINPNIAEGSASVQDAWVEMVGTYSTPSSGDGSVNIDITPSGQGKTTGSSINTDDGTATNYDILAMQDVSGQLLLTSNNQIDLVHVTEAISNKCAELVVTYNFNPYATGVNLQGNTVVYNAGQNSGYLSNAAQTTIGAAFAVTVPEASVSYDKIWVRYVFSDAQTTGANFTPKVLTSRDATGTTGSAYAIPSAGGTEQTGKNTIYFDITTYLSNSSYFQSGDTVTIQAQAGTASILQDVGAELVLSYRHNQTGASLTGAKTVYWFVGQRTTAASTNFTGSFVTYLPESSETWRSSAVRMDSPMGQVSTTARVSAVTTGTTTCATTGAGIDNTTTSNLGTNEAMTLAMFNRTPNSMANMAGETVNFCLRASANVINDNVGAVAYTTFTAAIPTIPEATLVLAALLIFLPRLVQILKSVEERRKWKEYWAKRAYKEMFKDLFSPYRRFLKFLSLKEASG